MADHSSSSVRTACNYQVLNKTTVNGINVSKLRSKKSGIVAYIAECSGPLVDGFVCLATEAHDHDGLPHTLEHLVFMGSELYPYKGVLDLLANRCLAQGTNAWTDVDHTCYTVSTAGRHGFLNLLPIYLDHILYPTLTDSAYRTEVHHVNGQGEDTGVVYCEMQARENTPEDMTHFALLQHMYPGRCGYRSETGGRLENLRISTSNAKVRSYHAQYYRPDNMAVVVVGQVTADELFASIAELEDRIQEKGPLPGMARPWQSQVPALEKSVSEEVKFPTESESMGMVRLAWRGPRAQDRYLCSSVEMLIEYLKETSVAPLQRELVEIGDPFCSKINALVLENSVTCIGFTFNGVPAAKLNGLQAKVMSVLEGLAAVDMPRMRSILKRTVLKNRESLEASPEYFFAFNILGDFLFADQEDQFPAYLDCVPRLEKLLEEPEGYWLELIKSIFIESPRVCIVGRPSVELSKKMNAEEKERTAEQAKSLGEEGLKKKEQTLSEAVEANESEPPDNLLSIVPIPDATTITHHSVTVVEGEGLSEKVRALPEYAQLPVDKFPFPLQLNQIRSSFVELVAVLDISVVPRELQCYLPLLAKLMFESPIMRNGVELPYERVVQELTEDTVGVSAGLGLGGGGHSCGKFPQAFLLSLKVESGKYSKAVRWLHEVLHSLVLRKERVRVTATKMLNSLAEPKRKGREIVRALSHWTTLDPASGHNLSNMYAQSTVLKELLSRLEKKGEEEEKVVEALRLVLDHLTSRIVRVHVNTDILNVSKTEEVLPPWQPLIENAKIQAQFSREDLLPPVVQSSDFVSQCNWGKSFIAGVCGVDSSYLILTTPCISSHGNSDYPAVLVYVEYLCALEGPMWRQIRGMGLSYHYSMACRQEQGLLVFLLYRSAQLAQAFTVAKGILDGFLSGETPFDPLQLEAAVSSTIFALVEREKTVADAAREAVLSSLRKTSCSYNQDLIRAVSTVTIEQLQEVGQKYFKKLFQPQFSSCAVCCTPNKDQEIKETLQRLGWEVTVIEDVEKMCA